jgi:hypothetical protein
MTENTTLLSLHARQKNAQSRGEISNVITGWMKCLSRGILQKVNTKGEGVLPEDEANDNGGSDHITAQVSLKLDALAKLLKLNPYNENGKFIGKLKSVSHDEISPVHIVCPDSVVCQYRNCHPRSLLQHTKPRDIPLVTLVKNFVSHEQVPVLSGQCPDCRTIYYADHVRVPTQQENAYDRVYLNTAAYIKIGQTLWVDRLFTSATISGIYNFHASPTTYATFWNMTFESAKLGRRHIWQAFVQESIRMQAAVANVDFTIADGLSIDGVTKEAFQSLGNDGIIGGSMQHSCKECTQKYRESYAGSGDIDPSAIVGMEDTSATPQFQTRIIEDCAPVKMVVMDGIVMGHTVSVILKLFI